MVKAVDRAVGPSITTAVQLVKARLDHQDERFGKLETRLDAIEANRNRVFPNVGDQLLQELLVSGRRVT